MLSIAGKDNFHANAVKFYSKLEKFRVNGRYTDVTIICEEESFKCHRVTLATASEYFDNMFGGGFEERTTDQSVFRMEMNAATFNEVMRYIYTGDVTVNHSNICGLIRASELLKLTKVQELCVGFVRGNKMSVENTFDVLCATTKKIFVETLILDIVNQFRIFCKNKKFLEIKLTTLNVILNKSRSLSIRNDDLFFGATIRWMFHDRGSRLRYAEKLLRNQFQLENLNSEYRAYFTKLLAKPRPAADALNSIKIKPIVGFDKLPEMRRFDAISRNAKYLNIFVRCSEEDTVRVFSLRGPGPCFRSREVFNVRSDHRIRSIAYDDDHIYTLHYPRGRPEQSETIFRLHDSVDLRLALELKKPPVTFEDLTLCTSHNNIYMCSKSKFRCGSSVITSYNCDLDTWMPIPTMEREFYTFGATTHDKILYLFGNETPYEADTTKNCIQVRAFDYRMATWLRLTPGIFHHSVRTDCCASDITDRILLHTGGPQPITISYNIKAGKWQAMDHAFQLNQPVQYRRIVSCLNRIWALGSLNEVEPTNLTFESIEYSNTLWNDPYSPFQVLNRPSKWSTSTLIQTYDEEGVIDKVSGLIFDAVFFRRPYE